LKQEPKVTAKWKLEGKLPLFSSFFFGLFENKKMTLMCHHFLLWLIHEEGECAIAFFSVFDDGNMMFFSMVMFQQRRQW
jgi:hypothetical protein